MFRGPSYGGRSRATATTLCQKCLKKDIYECKASDQERPYTSRPSRTQQLLNPKLAPKLMTDVPNDLLRKKGVADEQLAKIAAERGRKHDRGDDDVSHSPRKRSRSAYSYSSSVSTISTNRSPSPPPHKSRRTDRDTSMESPRKASALRKRRRTSASLSEAYSSSDDGLGRGRDRNTRMRMSSFSPAVRGRRRSRSYSNRMETSTSRSPVRRGRPQHGSPNTKMKSRSPSPAMRRQSPIRRRISSRSRSRGRRRSSPPRRPVAGKADDRSPDGFGEWRGPHRRGSRSRSRRPYRPKNLPQGGNRNGPREVARAKPTDDRRPPPPQAMGNGHGQPPGVNKERSLSPYSKRLALTQAIGMGGR